MNAVLIIFWMTLIASCLTAPVNDINLNEPPKDDLLLIINHLPDTIPFLPGLRHWIANPPDFNNPLMVIQFTLWYDTKVFPEMKRVTPIFSEGQILAEARVPFDLQSTHEYDDSKVVTQGLIVIENLLHRIRWSLVDLSSQKVSYPLHQVLKDWVLVRQKYLFEKSLSIMMAHARGFRLKSTIGKSDGLQFTRLILRQMAPMNYSQLIHDLYKTGMTIEQRIYDDFVRIRNDPSFSVEKLAQFITKYHSFILYHEEKKSPPRFEDIINVKYIPEPWWEPSITNLLQPSHTLTAPNSDGELLNAKSKRPSSGQTQTLENSKRQRLAPKHAVSTNMQSALLKLVLAHDDVIELMLSEWLDYMENASSTNLSEFAHGLEVYVFPWMKNIEVLLDSSSQYPEIGKSLGVAMNALRKVSTLLAELYKVLPKEIYENVTIIKFWNEYFPLALRHFYIQKLSSISEENILTFIKENSKFTTCMNRNRALFKILSEGKSAESMIQENFIKLCQKSEISREDLQQFAAINTDFLNFVKKGNDNSHRKITEDPRQNMASNYEMSPRQVGSSSPLVNNNDRVERHHRPDSSQTVGDRDASFWSSVYKGLSFN